MGKGDKKSKRGKIIMGSYGVSRPKKTAKPAAPKKEKPVEVEVKVKTTKPKAAKKTKIAEPSAPDAE
ncbi:MAG: 30S ribosomal protein THX [Lentimicrobium sp.]|nr:30S ribosomal protein THX [Lentimicrobium sp.]